MAMVSNSLPTLFPHLPAEPPPDDNSRSFKGHAQPHVDERLEQIKIFLADEDPNRCLHFRDKLSQIDEYLQYLEDEGVECDDDLFRDVTIMAEAHHDWDATIKEQMRYHDPCDRPEISTTSTRLIDTGEATYNHQMGKKNGMEGLMREEQGPFTDWKVGGAYEFLVAMKEALEEDPIVVDENHNLVAVERRAYEWASKEPALIPLWMHVKCGIEKDGVRPEDPDPWYGRGSGLRLFEGAKRPPMQQLPDLLESRQNAINELLALGDNRSASQELELSRRIEEHQPRRMKELKHQYESCITELRNEQENLSSEPSKRVSNAQQMEKTNKAKQNYEKNKREWTHELEEEGVQYMVGDPSDAVGKPLGVYYFPDAATADKEFKKHLFQASGQFARIKQHGFKQVKDQQKQHIIQSCWELFPQAAKDEYQEILAQDPNQNMSRHAIRLFSTWLASFVGIYTGMKMLKPGELVPDQSGEEKVYYFKFRQSPKALSKARRKAERNAVERARQMEVDDEEDLDDRYENSVDWRPRAERRGIKRAAIELGLNLLCPNHEQHRPEERFRIVDLPGPYHSAEFPDIPISLPLEGHERPLEIDPFEFTKRLSQWRQQNEKEYALTRKLVAEKDREALEPPANWRGPFTVASSENAIDVLGKRHAELANIYRQLIVVSVKASRPIIGAMIKRVEEGMHHEEGYKNEWADEEHIDLQQNDLTLLREITSDSWREPPQEDDGEIEMLFNEELKTMQEFEDDLEEVLDMLPLYEPEELPRRDPDDPDAEFRQPKHDPSVRGKNGMGFIEFQQLINNKRIERGGNLHLWTEIDIRGFLHHLKNIIHFDQINPQQVSQLAMTGHPENKYVSSRASAPYSAGVHTIHKGETAFHLVQYKSDGTTGLVTIQANKWYHFQKLSFRLGRDLTRLLRDIADYNGTLTDRFTEQWDGMGEADDAMKELSKDDILACRRKIFHATPYAEPEAGLVDIVEELHKIAPDLAKEAGITFRQPTDESPGGITEKEAAVLLQMQVLEEVNNNRDRLFPENEHVWDIAARDLDEEGITPYTLRLRNGGKTDRKPVPQFFNMRRFPLCCQSEETQRALRSAGPKILEKGNVKPREKTELEIQKEQSLRGEKPLEIYRGANAPPFFPFGETPFQERFLSWRMTQELEGVEEFQSKKESRGWFKEWLSGSGDGEGNGARVYQNLRLPKLPEGFIAGSRSVEEYWHEQRVAAEVRKRKAEEGPEGEGRAKRKRRDE